MSNTNTSNASVTKKVTELICNELNVEPAKVVPEASFIDDLGADSLDIVELVMTMEEEFNIEIPDEEAEKLRRVQDVTDYINSKVNH